LVQGAVSWRSIVVLIPERLRPRFSRRGWALGFLAIAAGILLWMVRPAHLADDIVVWQGVSMRIPGEFSYSRDDNWLEIEPRHQGSLASQRSRLVLVVLGAADTDAFPRATCFGTTAVCRVEIDSSFAAPVRCEVAGSTVARPPVILAGRCRSSTGPLEARYKCYDEYCRAFREIIQQALRPAEPKPSALPRKSE
jgi:hypothetical protein